MARTNAVTIDNYNVEAHERYATDQSLLDFTFIKESNIIAPHFEMAGGQSTIASKWDELFETHLNKHPFALFAPPPKFSGMRNRFFSYAISPEFDWVEADEDADEEKQRKEQKKLEEYKEKIQSKKSKSTPIALLEKDRTALFNLLDSIQMLNGFLREVHARKLQYQKG